MEEELNGSSQVYPAGVQEISSWGSNFGEGGGSFALLFLRPPQRLPSPVIGANPIILSFFPSNWLHPETGRRAWLLGSGSYPYKFDFAGEESGDWLVLGGAHPWKGGVVLCSPS